MLSFSICKFSLVDVEIFVRDHNIFSKVILNHECDFVNLYQIAQPGAAIPAMGYFFHPKINDQILLFTSNMSDGWDSLLYRICTRGTKNFEYFSFRFSEDPIFIEFKYFKNKEDSRIVMLMDEGRGGRLDFYEKGEVLPFENLENYKKRIKKDRLNFDMLKSYAMHLGLPRIDQTIFLPAGNYLKIQENRKSVN